MSGSESGVFIDHFPSTTNMVGWFRSNTDCHFINWNRWNTEVGYERLLAYLALLWTYWINWTTFLNFTTIRIFAACSDQWAT
ncbi:hypothetical protein BpHYR1_035946 [Brachionus plicatilis]|uniref:Uncharacterized protein n=1 Tax=Brachionus plicatilis TaxID=10195 RepID=A0A3M7QS30_BRAPC|nr:hypothetical protein BpHYR1_035946 [Brachionus plicatilis]